MGIKDRLTRLEGGRENRRCSCGFVVIRVGGEFVRASRHGVPITEEEWLDYDATNTDRSCGLCGGELPPKIKIGGRDHAARGVSTEEDHYGS